MRAGSRAPIRGSRRRFLLAVATAALGTVGCGDRPALRVGLLNTFSGTLSDAGADMRDGALLAFEDASPRVAVQWFEYDDEGRVDTLPALARRMQRDRIEAVLGPATSTLSKVWLPYADTHRWLTISPTATAVGLSGHDDHFFRVCSNTESDARLAAEQMARHVQPQRVTAVYHTANALFSQSWADVFLKTFAGMGVSQTRLLPYDPQAPGGDWLPGLVEAILTQPPDLLALATPTADTVRIVQRLARSAFRPVIVCSDWAAMGPLLDWGGQAIEGVYLAHEFDPDSRQGTYQTFVQRFVQTYGRQPHGEHVRAYDAASVLMRAAIERADGESLKAAVLRLRRFDGLQSPIVFDDWGDCIRPLHLSVIRQGRLERV